MYMQACLLSKRCIADSNIERHAIGSAVLTTVVAKNIYYSLHNAHSRSPVKHLPPRMSCILLLQGTLVQTHQSPHILPPSSLLPECWNYGAPPQSSCSSGRYHHTGQKNSWEREEVTQLSLVLSPHVPPGKKRSGEQFLGPIPKCGKPDFPYSSKFCLLHFCLSDCCQFTLVTKAHAH